MKYFITLCLLLAALWVQSQTDSTMASAPPAVAQQGMDSTTTSTTAVKSLEEIREAAKDFGAPSLTDLISLTKIFWSIAFLLLGYLFIRIATRTLTILAERSTHYRIAIKGFVPVVKILGWITLIFIVVAGIFQPPAATLLAFSASIGVAVGFASQDILKNIFGGVMILFDRPFQVGDKIDAGGHYGEVTEIGLRSTRIVTADDNLVSIPNSEIMNNSVSNANAGESNCQVVAQIYLPLDTDTSRARAIGKEAAMVSKFAYLNKPVAVNFTNEFKDRQSILKMVVKAYVLDIRDEFRFKSEVTEITIKKLLEEGILGREGALLANQQAIPMG